MGPQERYKDWAANSFLLSTKSNMISLLVWRLLARSNQCLAAKPDQTMQGDTCEVPWLQHVMYSPDIGNVWTGLSLESLHQRCKEIVHQYIQGYIWQRDPFQLHISSQEKQPWLQAKPESSDMPTCLWGQTSYGDNVEDEWFIVWLLMELTKRLSVTARIWDSDGEFLLTEAAYVLPE